MLRFFSSASSDGPSGTYVGNPPAARFLRPASSRSAPVPAPYATAWVAMVVTRQSGGGSSFFQDEAGSSDAGDGGGGDVGGGGMKVEVAAGAAARWGKKRNECEKRDQAGKVNEWRKDSTPLLGQTARTEFR